jgi:hypothetical protein
LREAELLQPLDRTSRSGRVDSECFGEIPHPPFGLLDEEVECVHLADLEGILADAEEMLDESTHRSSTTDFAPGATDTQRVLALYRVVEVDSGSIGGGHLGSRVQVRN